MHIVVCIKQVPDSSEVRINPETGTLIREGVPSIVNPYDMHAVEAGLQIKEKIGGKVIALTMGPPQAESALREVISMGVDDGILLSDRVFAGSDTWATSYTISRAMERLKPDLILCGKQAIDGDTAQVGPEVAEMLNIPHVAYVRKILSIGDCSIKVERLMEEGFDVVESALPALLTVVKEINQPRLPSLKGKMAAKKAVITKWGHKDIGSEEEKCGLKGSPTQVKKIFAPESRKDRRLLTGSVEEQVNALVEELRRLKCL